MKICFITRDLDQTNGWGRYSKSLISSLLDEGVEVKILGSVECEKESLNNVKISKILPPIFTSRYRQAYHFLKNYFKIKKELKGCDIVHVLVEPYLPIINLCLNDQRLFSTVHGTYGVLPLTKKSKRAKYAKVFRRCEKVIAVSNYTKDKLLEHLQLDNIVVIHNGVNVEKFRRRVEKQYSNTKNVLSVGEIHRRKGYHLVIPAIAKVREKFNNVRYKIVGNVVDKKYFEELHQMIEDLGLKEVVTFAHKLSDDELINEYHMADLFVLIPVDLGGVKFEGFGQVYLEAMAAGVPVVASEKSAAAEFISDYNGFLLSENRDQLTSKLLSIFTNQSLLQEISRQAFAEVKEMGWSSILKKYLSFYKGKTKKWRLKINL